MRYLVAMKQVPDLEQLRIRNRQPILDDVPFTYSKPDKNALEAAVQLKEQNGGEVIVLSVGGEELEDTVKEAMAAGGDSSILVMDDTLAGAESPVIAQILAELVRRTEDVGLLFFSEGSADNYTGQVGPRVAEILNLPQVSCVTAIEIKDGKAILTRSLSNREEVVAVSLPAVVIVEADLNEPRLPSVTQVLKAGKKPKELIELDELQISTGSRWIETKSNLAAELNRQKKMLKNTTELVETLLASGLGR